MKRASVTRVVRVAIVGAALVALGVLLARDLPALLAAPWRPRPLLLAASVALHAAGLAGGIAVWIAVAARVAGEPTRRAVLLRLWWPASAARWLPGKVWTFVVAGSMAREGGGDGAVVVTSMLVHAGFGALGAAVAAAVAWAAAGTTPAARLGGVLPAAVLLMAFLLVHPAVIGRAVAVAGRLSRRPLLAWRGRWRDGAALLAACAALWGVAGASFALLAAALVPVAPPDGVALAGAYALGFLAGYAVPLAPAGLGARDLALAVLVAPHLPNGLGPALAVAARPWAVAAEAVVGLGALALARRATPPAPLNVTPEARDATGD